MLKSHETETIQFLQPLTKSPLTLTDISSLTHTIPNTTNLLWPKLYTTESIHMSRTAMTKQHFTNKCNRLMDFLTLDGFPHRFSCLAIKEKPCCPTNFFKSFTCLPYIHVVGVRVAMRPFVTIQSLSHPPRTLWTSMKQQVFIIKFHVMIALLFKSVKVNETC